ncbi:Uncharacterized protein APZ42_034284 [Daphnia magna]|uniref:CCHC-type domain-containing protein n=1 Tax=Daphnia magna TaxID=35525 RepID=A0A164K9L0_9CRUS|nr:Uncharacterized protein APZ42_034284 [Daphnia magna]
MENQAGPNLGDGVGMENQAGPNLGDGVENVVLVGVQEGRFREREPPVFNGNAGEDVMHWITRFERIADYNSWNATRRFAHLGMCLEGVALEWYLSLAPQPQDYQTLRIAILNAFKDPNYEYDLESQFRNRFQGLDEPVMTYCYNIVYLCSKLDPNMAEPTKVNHILRGLKPTLLERVYPLVETGVTDTQALFNLVLRHSQAMHLANRSDWSSKIITTTQCLPIMNSSTSNSFITRKELEGSMNTLKRELKGEITEVKSSLETTLVSHLSSIEKLIEKSTHSNQPFSNARPFKRTSDGRPICNNCTRAGHIARNC